MTPNARLAQLLSLVLRARVFTRKSDGLTYTVDSVREDGLVRLRRLPATRDTEPVVVEPAELVDDALACSW